MAYVIQYGGQVALERKHRRPKKKAWIAAVLVLALAVGIYGFWPEAVEQIRHVLIPGEDAVTVEAFQNMVDNLRFGDSFSECLTTFCQEVIYGAG